MRIILAPMEGVIDNEMRAVLTGLGGYDRCVTEFIRINDNLLPERVFYRLAPELLQGGHTDHGVPVYVQLLGGNPHYMALNARRAQSLGPPGIDLNFGCPSKTVTKNNGGSSLLRSPQRIGDIVSAVRDAVDPAIPVTAKIRLGFDHHDDFEKIVEQIVQAGATELCVHARTKADKYKAPAYWSEVRRISKSISIPLIVNGEIWSLRDATQARQDSGCVDIMLGRGGLTYPDLAAKIKADHSGYAYQEMCWSEAQDMIIRYLKNTENKHPYFVSNRSKQWLAFLLKRYPEAMDLFQRIKRMKEASDVFGEFRKPCLV